MLSQKSNITAYKFVYLGLILQPRKLNEPDSHFALNLYVLLEG